MAQIFAIDFRHGQSMAAEVPGKLEEGYVLFTHVIQNANGADEPAFKPDDVSPEPPSFPCSGCTRSAVELK